MLLFCLFDIRKFCLILSLFHFLFVSCGMFDCIILFFFCWRFTYKINLFIICYFGIFIKRISVSLHVILLLVNFANEICSTKFLNVFTAATFKALHAFHWRTIVIICWPGFCCVAVVFTWIKIWRIKLSITREFIDCVTAVFINFFHHGHN